MLIKSLRLCFKDIWFSRLAAIMPKGASMSISRARASTSTVVLLVDRISSRCLECRTSLPGTSLSSCNRRCGVLKGQEKVV